MSQYFPKPFEPFGGDISVKVDLSNYATKAYFKNVTHVHTSSFALKANLANLKTEVDKLDTDKLAPVPVDVSKLSDVVKNDVVKKTIYEKLVAKVNSIDTTRFVLKTNYDTDKSEIENKISNTSAVVKKADYNTKITEIEDKRPDVSSLGTKVALTTVENKIPDVSSLAKKTDYDTSITEIEKKFTDHDHDKYITTPEFNTMAASVFNARLAQAYLVAKTDFDAKLSSLNKKVTENKTKHLLVDNELTKLKTFDLSYFIGKSHFEEDGTQNYLVFQPINRYFKVIANALYISSWKSKGLSDETINHLATYDNSLTSLITSYTHGTIVNIYIVFELGASGSNDNDPTQKIVYLVQLH